MHIVLSLNITCVPVKAVQSHTELYLCGLFLWRAPIEYLPIQHGRQARRHSGGIKQSKHEGLEKRNNGREDHWLGVRKGGAV